MPEEERKAMSVVKALSNLTGDNYWALKDLTYADAFEQAALILEESKLIDDVREFMVSYGLPDPRNV